MDIRDVKMCLGNSTHEPHNVQVTVSHTCEGPRECNGSILTHRSHSITKVLLVPCNGLPA